MRRPLATLAALALLLGAAAAPAFAADAPAPKVRDEKDKIVLENDQITVWFQGKKPMLKILPANKTDDAFELTLRDFVEFEDMDGDGAPSAGEIRALLNLHAASGWQVEQTEEDGLVVLTLTLEAPIKYRGPLAETPLDPVVNKDKTANVSFVFRLGAAAVTLPAGNESLTLLPTETKFDVIVNRWVWADPAKDLLALTFDAGETGNATLAEGEPRAVLESGNLTRGYFTWLDEATATKGGENATVPVTVAPLADEAGRYALVYGVGGFTTLLHDPVVGASPSGEPVTEAEVPDAPTAVPALGAVALVAAAVGAVLVARRR